MVIDTTTKNSCSPRDLVTYEAREEHFETNYLPTKKSYKDICSFVDQTKKTYQNTQKRLKEVVSFKVLKEVILFSLRKVTETNKNLDCCKNLVTFQEASVLLNNVSPLDQKKFVKCFIEQFKYSKNRQISFYKKYKQCLFVRTNKENLFKALVSALPIVGILSVYLPTVSVILFGSCIIYLTDRGFISSQHVEFNPCSVHDNYRTVRVREVVLTEENLRKCLMGALSAAQASALLNCLLDR